MVCISYNIPMRMPTTSQERTRSTCSLTPHRRSWKGSLRY